ncbi:hypothetical protein diail_1045 [Diaporthe ilicicola]|nr:hypothetical protein diail_1045 [Diaporthe ilicicola]
MGKYDRKEKSQPKHGKPPDSGASRAPAQITPGIPGWKGPGYIHKKKKPQQSAAGSATAEPPKLDHILPFELEQMMVDIFRTTFPASNDFEALKPTLQDIKDALFRRDFDTAFGRADFLEAYAIRWSPSRALGYAQLLAWVCEERADDACIQQLVDGGDDQRPAKVICFGGGAAEIMAFSGLLRHLRLSQAGGRPDSSPGDVSKDLKALSISEADASTTLLELNLIDTADWASVLSKLHTCLETPPTLSKYASAIARATNASFLSPGAIKHTFTRTDALGCSTEELRAAIGPDPALLTLLFTLNELYTASMPRTTAFLLRVTDVAPKGSLLLVVDSPGSYSETAIGSAKEGEEKKKYPMSWLMDYALVPKSKKQAGNDESEGAESTCAWEKVMAEDSIWYRLEEELKYPRRVCSEELVYNGILEDRLFDKLACRLGGWGIVDHVWREEVGEDPWGMSLPFAACSFSAMSFSLLPEPTLAIPVGSTWTCEQIPQVDHDGPIGAAEGHRTRFQHHTFEESGPNYLCLYKNDHHSWLELCARSKQRIELWLRSAL